MSETIQIVDIIQQQDKKWVVLSPNALYTGGGGQPPDRGKLVQGEVEARLEQVMLFQDGIAWEVPIDSNYQAGEALLFRDELFHWEISQQHTAQHIFSGWASFLFGWKSDGFAIQQELSKIELCGANDDPDCYKELEKRTCESILSDIPIEISEQSGENQLRKTIQHDRVRVVSIKGVDQCGCGGTHVVSTGQIGGFAVLFRERKNKNAVRIWFAAGLRLGKIVQAFYHREQRLRNLLSGDVEERITSLVKEVDQHQKTEQWFWQQLTNFIPEEKKTVELQNLPISLNTMKTIASLLLKKNIGCYLEKQDH
jgi:alanyl-tRNA synthetase